MTDLTQEDVREILIYDPATGSLTWRANRGRAKAGDDATQPAVKGYRKVKLHRRYYQAHRVIWLLSYGQWPSQTIDHINGVRSDNRLANLRDVSMLENLRNRRGRFSRPDDYADIWPELAGA